MKPNQAMKASNRSRGFCAATARLLTVALTFAAIVTTTHSVRSQATASVSSPLAAGQINGAVSNAGTKALLEGAVVEIPALGLSTTTDASGQYRFRNLPPGEYSLQASYSGLDLARKTSQVSSQQTARVDIELQSDVYQMGAFYAIGEREGNAAAITEQRNAESIRTAVAFDAYGNLFNNELGELAVQLPGIAGLVGDEGIVTRVSIRGSDYNLNSVTIDGNKMVSTAPRARQYTMNQLPSGFFEKMEVTKAVTPDIDADSIGGNINMTTRTGMKLGEKRRQELQITAKWAPTFYPHNPRTRDHPLHGFGSYTYRERFDVLGGERNLAISFNLSYRENAVEVFNTNNNYQGVTTTPALMTATNIYEAYNNRKTLGGMLRIDYKLTPNVSMFATVMYNDQYEPSFQFLRFGSANAATVATLNASGQPVGTGAVLPGYTERFAEVVPQATSRVQLSSEGNRFRDIQRQRSLGFAHTYGSLKFDYNAMHGESNVEQKDDESGGIFTTTITGIGFRQERMPDGSMSWTQTAGPSVFDLTNYPIHRSTQKFRKRLNGVNAFTFNAEYTPDARTKSFIKAGLRIRSEASEIEGGDTIREYIGPDGVRGINAATGINDDDLKVFQLQGVRTRSGQPYPFVNVASIAADIKEHPERWGGGDAFTYFNRSQDFQQTSGAKEQVNAAYIMGGGTWKKRLRLVGGVRIEDTRVRGKGFIPLTLRATAAQVPAPIARAEHDWNHPGRTDGGYTKWFPSGLLTYSFTRNLLARFNWTNSIGRPTFGILVPMESVNNTAETVTVANPSILPQMARTLEASLEYYFEPVGLFTASVFQKNIKDYIVRTTSGFVESGSDNGFGGSYAGYTLINDQNSGTATVKGIELNYQHQLTFLPGAWSGLSLMGNYTRLLPEGDFGSLGPRTTNLIPLFVPTSGNIGITFKYKKLLTRVLWNYTGKYLITYSTNAALLAYIDERRTVNASVSYIITPRTRMFCDIANVFNEPNRRYLYQSERRTLLSYSGAWINAGFKVEF